MPRPLFHRPGQRVARRALSALLVGALGFCVAAASPGEPPPGSPERPLRMMFVPSGEARVILKGGEAIARLVRRHTGLQVTASVATSYAAVIEAMGAGQVDIGWLAALSYVLAHDKYGVELLLIVERFGSPFYRGQILVRADSGLKTLGDLKGKRFAFVDPASASGHLYPKTLLIRQGYAPETFFSKSVFAGSHNAVVLSVLKGDVDAGATYDDARAAVARTYPEVFDRLRVIAYTPPIPNDTVSVRGDLPPAIKDRLKRGLLALSKTGEGARLLKQVYGISGLMDLDGLFDPLREAHRLLHPRAGP